MWDLPSMHDSTKNKCEPKLLSKKNANAFFGLQIVVME
jgi:hypothetical protein